MSDRCIVAVRFTPTGSMRQVGRAVGGFLRYVQHRDLHAAEAKPVPPRPEVAGMLKYVAYRDRASARAELFGPEGTMGSGERKAFAAFVLRSLEESRPQLYRARSGEQGDRRRAVFRLVISPERASGLDLRRLTATAVASIEAELEGDRLQWMAAIHRNTAHPHVHLVIAGMRETAQGFRRFDLTKPRLAAMKAAVAGEISRQRGERRPMMVPARRSVANTGDETLTSPLRAVSQPRLVRYEPRRVRQPRRMPVRRSVAIATSLPMLRVRAVARHYVRQLELAAAKEARERGWEYAA